MLRTKMLAVAVTAVASLAVASAAQASKPYMVHLKDYPASYTDDFCGFDSQVNGSDKVTIQDFFDKQGNLVREVFHDEFTGTVTHGSVTLNKVESANITDDYTNGNEYWSGLEVRYSYPSGGTIAQDTGPIVFDGNGDTIEEHGQHPYADGPGEAAVCAALAAG
jgi:opacity protein-like surface antigen